MKNRHTRNNSLLQEKTRVQQFTHHRSFSYTRHRRHSTLLQMHHLTPQNINTQSITLPLSTQLHSKNRPRKIEKAGSKGLRKQKKKGKERDELGNFYLKRGFQEQALTKRSVEKGEKLGKLFSKELIRYKYSHEKEHSSEKRRGTSGQLKRKSNKKHNKSPQQNKKNKIKQQEDPSQQWQNILVHYGNYLTPAEVVEIKQYKLIYFLGKIKERKDNGVRPLSGLQETGATQTEEDQFYKYEIGDHIAYRYEIIESINQGSFGEVLKVFDHKTGQNLALKIVKKSQELVQQTFMEISILTQIREKDKANMSGVVRIKDFTIFRNHICMLFELLDGNLYELLVANGYCGLKEDEVRIFAFQILNSLNFIHKEGVIHCDIKPENIVMRNWGKTGVKLIDFGTSCFQGKQVYDYLQSRYYRAPEVIFKNIYSHPIDMWSFACVIAELKLGEPIFAASSNIEQLTYITNSIGLPSKQDGPYSSRFLQSSEFQQLLKEDYISQYYELLKNGKDLKDDPFFKECKYARTCMRTLKERILSTQQNDDLDFYNFLKKILVWEPGKRLSPQQALQDPWITKGLPIQIRSIYTTFNSVEYPKKQKKSSKDSKNSSSKSNARKSKEKRVLKDHSGQKKQESTSREGRSKGQPKFQGYSGKTYGDDYF